VGADSARAARTRRARRLLHDLLGARGSLGGARSLRFGRQRTGGGASRGAAAVPDEWAALPVPGQPHGPATPALTRRATNPDRSGRPRPREGGVGDTRAGPRFAG